MKRVKNYLLKKGGRKILFAFLGYAANKISKTIQEKGKVTLNYRKFKNKSEMEISNDGEEFYVIPVKDFHNCIEG